MRERITMVRCCNSTSVRDSYTALLERRGVAHRVYLFTDRQPLPADPPKPHGRMHEALLSEEEDFLR